LLSSYGTYQRQCTISGWESGPETNFWPTFNPFWAITYVFSISIS
jgi:hypothetical protein